MDLSNPATLANLEAALGGESMANRKYLFFADLAKQLGNVELPRLFRDTAHQETEHGLRPFPPAPPRARGGRSHQSQPRAEAGHP